MIEQKVLANNVVLITEKIESAKTASIGFWFSAGSRYESKENRGISHLTEHLLFKGTETVSARNLALSFDRMGGFINAFTERENVCIYCAVPALNGNFETAAGHLFDMSENCIFPEDEFEREKSVVQN
ncbi:MAG: insulinase family protein, partial [Treponema sp.]|nr:insulinase family protein [Treponema sp.]